MPEFVWDLTSQGYRPCAVSYGILSVTDSSCTLERARILVGLHRGEVQAATALPAFGSVPGGVN